LLFLQSVFPGVFVPSRSAGFAPEGIIAQAAGKRVAAWLCGGNNGKNEERKSVH